MSTPMLGVSNALIRLAGYRWLMLLSAIVFASVAFLYTYKQPPAFTAYARLLPPQTNMATADALLKQVGGEPNLGSAALSLKSPSDLYASLFVSRTVQQYIVEKYQLQKHYDIEDQDSLFREVKKRTKVDVGKDGIITLAYTDKTPELSAQITNAMIDAMYDLARRLAIQESERRSQFYKGLIEKARLNLYKADKELASLERETGLTRLKGQEEATAAAVAELRGLIASREVELAKLRVSMTLRHPDVIALSQEIGALKEQLNQLEQGVYKQGNQQIFVPIDQYVSKKDTIEPARREVEMRSKVLEQLIQVESLSQVDETRDLSIIQVLDRAIPPSKKSGPRVKLNTLAAGIVGFLFGVVLAFTWEMAFSDAARRTRWKEVVRAMLRLRRRQEK